MKKIIVSLICIAFLLTFFLTIKSNKKVDNKELKKVKVAE